MYTLSHPPVYMPVPTYSWRRFFALKVSTFKATKVCFLFLFSWAITNTLTYNHIVTVMRVCLHVQQRIPIVLPEPISITYGLTTSLLWTMLIWTNVHLIILHLCDTPVGTWCDLWLSVGPNASSDNHIHDSCNNSQDIFYEQNSLRTCVGTEPTTFQTIV